MAGLRKGREVKDFEDGGKTVVLVDSFGNEFKAGIFSLSFTELRKAYALKFSYTDGGNVLKLTADEIRNAIRTGIVPEKATRANTELQGMITDKQSWKIDQLRADTVKKGIYVGDDLTRMINRKTYLTKAQASKLIGDLIDLIEASERNPWDTYDKGSTPKVDSTPNPSTPNNGADMQVMSNLIDDLSNQVDKRFDEFDTRLTIDEEAITDIKLSVEALKNLQPKIVNVILPDRSNIKLDEHTHEVFEDALTVIGSGCNLLLVGPAGTGKTTLCRQLSKAMATEYAAQGFSPDMMTSVLFGYKNAMGEYVGTEFRRIYEFGGIFLFDELDNVNPSIAAGMNMAIDNSIAAFPDGMVNKNPDTYFVAGANTFGTGPTAEYVGRMRQDAAFLNRWVKLEMDYDQALEWKIGHAIFDDAVTDKWIEKVYQYRVNAQEHRIKEVFGTRNIVQGVMLLKGGMAWDKVVKAVLQNGGGISDDTLVKLEG